MNSLNTGKEGIKRFLIHWANAMARKDAIAVTACYAADNVMYILAPPLQYVSGQNSPGQTGVQEWFDTFKGDLVYEIHDVHIETADSIAFCHNLVHLVAQSVGGDDIDMWFRNTLGLIYEEGWKIKHEHQSVPFYMDSLKAAMDLTPDDE